MQLCELMKVVEKVLFYKVRGELYSQMQSMISSHFNKWLLMVTCLFSVVLILLYHLSCELRIEIAVS